jgi:hypothetical protein
MHALRNDRGAPNVINESLGQIRKRDPSHVASLGPHEFDAPAILAQQASGDQADDARAKDTRLPRPKRKGGHCTPVPMISTNLSRTRRIAAIDRKAEE